MQRFATLLALSAALLAAPALASDKYAGTITSSGSSATNSSTGTPFKNAEPNTLGGLHVAVQCDAAAYVKPVTTASGTVSSSNGVKVQTDALYDIDMAAGEKYLAVISVSGTANCKVFIRTVILR